MDSLNALRQVLVGTAVIAMLVAAGTGRWLAASVLAVAVVVHGGFTVYLGRSGVRRRPQPPSGA